MIEVFYNGSYPATCMGTLTIKQDGVLLYEKELCCHSTGCAGVDSEYNDYVEEGDLLWEDYEAMKFSPEIQEAVRDKLSEFSVCCGGCI
jgi:hypothetical protein